MTNKDDGEERAFRALIRLVSVQPRTEAEATRRLAGKGFPAQVVRQAVERGCQTGLLDDRLYAKLYAEDRLLSRPCSRGLVADELRRKGVDPELARAAADSALPEESEEELAQRALQGGRGLWGKLSAEAAQRRAAAFLLRRGFSPEAARRALESGWKDDR